MHPGNIQNWVDHSPALGVEFGSNLLYRVTRNLTIKGGLLFNFSRYKILASACIRSRLPVCLFMSGGLPYSGFYRRQLWQQDAGDPL